MLYRLADTVQRLGIPLILTNERGQKIMTRRLDETLKCLRLLPRAMAVMLAVCAPLLAIPYLQASDEAIILAPTMKNSGAGFVLMVSLQRG